MKKEKRGKSLCLSWLLLLDELRWYAIQLLGCVSLQQFELLTCVLCVEVIAHSQNSDLWPRIMFTSTNLASKINLFTSSKWGDIFRRLTIKKHSSENSPIYFASLLLFFGEAKEQKLLFPMNKSGKLNANLYGNIENLFSFILVVYQTIRRRLHAFWHFVLFPTKESGEISNKTCHKQ